MTQYHRQLEDELIAVPPRQRALTAADQSAGLSLRFARTARSSCRKGVNQRDVH